MINLESLASEIEEFFEVSGDDISSVINHGSVLSFSHTSLIMRNFNYEISIDNKGVVKLLSQKSISNESALDQDVSGASAKTLSKEVVVREGEAFNIQDVIKFISECAA